MSLQSYVYFFLVFKACEANKPRMVRSNIANKNFWQGFHLIFLVFLEISSQ
jgi:hypothetical protein